MEKLLVVDDDPALRQLVRLNLGDAYEIVDTGEPDEALALALEHQPGAILLDLRMPGFSGFQLCQTLTSFCTTKTIPFFVVSGDATQATKDYCHALGAAGYFQKPVDFDALRARLSQVVKGREVVLRSEVRVNLHIPLKLRWTGPDGKLGELATATDDVSISGFLFAADTALEVGLVLDVYLTSISSRHSERSEEFPLSSGEELRSPRAPFSDEEKYVGKAKIVRRENAPGASAQQGTPAQQGGPAQYGCRFVEKTGRWVLE